MLLTVTMEESNLHGSLGRGLQQVGTGPLLNAEEKMLRASPGGQGLPVLGTAGRCKGLEGQGEWPLHLEGKWDKGMSAAHHLTAGRLC